ncbi:MAG: hypothetical protein U5L74_12630 [Ideonella sp.]|nr:hypothetical protein [Ideonella sp.]
MNQIAGASINAAKEGHPIDPMSAIFAAPGFFQVQDVRHGLSWHSFASANVF